MCGWERTKFTICIRGHKMSIQRFQGSSTDLIKSWLSMIERQLTKGNIECHAIYYF